MDNPVFIKVKAPKQLVEALDAVSRHVLDLANTYDVDSAYARLFPLAKIIDSGMLITKTNLQDVNSFLIILENFIKDNIISLSTEELIKNTTSTRELLMEVVK